MPEEIRTASFRKEKWKWMKGYMEEGIIIRCSSVTQKHICLDQVCNRLTHTQMHGQHDIYKHCCQLEEWKRGKCILKPRQAGSGGWDAAQQIRRAAERMILTAICSLGLTVLLHTEFIKSSPSAGLPLHICTFQIVFTIPPVTASELLGRREKTHRMCPCTRS